jgi:hypothetical protein
MISKRFALGLAIEQTYGTYEAVSGANCDFRCEAPNLSIVGETITRENSAGSIGYDKGVPSAFSTALTFRNHLCGKGASGVPAWSNFLKACGMGFGVSYVQTVDVSDWLSLSGSFWQDGRRRKARGLMGNAVFNLNAGQPVQIDWSFVGGWVATPDDDAIPGVGARTEAVPPVWGGASGLTIGGTAVKAGSATIDLGTNPSLRADPNSTKGFIGGYLGTPAPTLTLDPDALLVASRCWYAAQEAGTELDIVFTVGTVANNIITITCNDCQVNAAPEDGDRNGILTDAIGLNINGGIAITFT